MTDDSEREYKQAMSERFGATKDYLGSVANRTIGRAAWKQAVRAPELEMDTYTGDERPAWARKVSKVLGYAAPLCFILEVTAPATSRLITSILQATYKETPGRYDHLKTALMIPTMAIDITLNYGALFLSHTLSEVVAYKLVANAATHVGLDAASAVANRIRNHRPTNTTLAV